MVAKLALALVVLAILLVAVTIAAYRYFDKQAERQHEKDMRQMEQTEKLFDE